MPKPREEKKKDEKKANNASDKAASTTAAPAADTAASTASRQQELKELKMQLMMTVGTMGKHQVRLHSRHTHTLLYVYVTCCVLTGGVEKRSAKQTIAVGVGRSYEKPWRHKETNC